MHSFTVRSVLLSILSLSLLSSALPTPPPDCATLLANAQEAQKLNAEFANLKSTDPCQDGQSACIDGAEATCVGTTWQTTQCPQGGAITLSCFALPSVRHPGTINACVSEDTAVALIEGLGATGGIDGSDGTGPAVTTDGAATVTVTITSTPTVTLDPVTTTLPLTALGDLTSGSPAPTNPAAVVVATPTITLGGAPPAPPPPTTAPAPPTITLNGAAPTSSPPVVNGGVGGAPQNAGALPTITLTGTPVGPTPAAAPAQAPPAPAPAPAAASPSPDSGGYGYGGY